MPTSLNIKIILCRENPHCAEIALHSDKITTSSSTLDSTTSSPDHCKSHSNIAIDDADVKELLTNGHAKKTDFISEKETEDVQ